MSLDSDYVKQLEDRIEELQRKVTSAHTTLNNYLAISYVVDDKTISVSLYYMCNNVVEHTKSLCTAIKTNVDEVARWYLEFNNGDRGYAEITQKPEDIVSIVTNKFNLENVRINERRFNKNGDSFNTAIGYRAGYIYAPYIPLQMSPNTAMPNKLAKHWKNLCQPTI